MTRQIRKGSKLVGYYQESGRGTELRSASHVLLGYYDPKCDQTRKGSGAYYANGNCLADLLTG